MNYIKTMLVLLCSLFIGSCLNENDSTKTNNNIMEIDSSTISVGRPSNNLLTSPKKEDQDLFKSGISIFRKYNSPPVNFNDYNYKIENIMNEDLYMYVLLGRRAGKNDEVYVEYKVTHIAEPFYNTFQIDAFQPSPAPVQKPLFDHKSSSTTQPFFYPDLTFVKGIRTRGFTPNTGFNLDIFAIGDSLKTVIYIIPDSSPWVPINNQPVYGKGRQKFTVFNYGSLTKFQKVKGRTII